MSSNCDNCHFILKKLTSCQISNSLAEASPFELLMVLVSASAYLFGFIFAVRIFFSRTLRNLTLLFIVVGGNLLSEFVKKYI